MSGQVQTRNAVNAADFEAISKIVRRIERQESVSLEVFANWKLSFLLWKDLDLKFAMAKAPKVPAGKHRAILTEFLALSERLDNAVKATPDSELSKIGLSQEGFEVSLNLLRKKYKAWYVPVNPDLERELNEKIAALSR